MESCFVLVSVEEGETGRDAGDRNLRPVGISLVLRILKVIFEVAKRSQTTCCFLMCGFKSECLLRSNVFLQVGCK